MDFKLISILTNHQTVPNLRKHSGRGKNGHWDTFLLSPKSCVCLPLWKESPHPDRSSMGKTPWGLPALLLHSRARGAIFSKESCNAEIVHFLPLHVLGGHAVLRGHGFPRVACKKRRETKNIMFCSSRGQFYLVAACKDREIFKLIPSGVTDIFKPKKTPKPNQNQNSAKIFQVCSSCNLMI